MEDIEIFRKKLLFKASHRGTKEMDILIGNFASKYITLFDLNELNLLNDILDTDDDEIYKMILHKIEIPSSLNNRVTKLLIDSSNDANE